MPGVMSGNACSAPPLLLIRHGQFRPSTYYATADGTVRCSASRLGQELELERWSNDFHAMVRPELLQGGFLVLWYCLPDLAHLLKKSLDAARRLKQDQHLPLRFTGPGERMGYFARRKRRIARSKIKGVLAHLNNELASHNIKPFVLKVVAVEGRATLRLANGVIDAKVTSRVPPRDL